MKIFGNNNSLSKGFEYLDSQKYFYFDSACQTLRPQEVIDAEVEYYKKFNACGHRVKYKWGEIVDKKVQETRDSILKIVGKNSKEYSVGFTLNTTFGINTVLHQIKPNKFNQVVTSEIEHNSVFLPSITYAKKNNLKGLILPRDFHGNLEYSIEQIKNSIVLVNTTSNIDGRNLLNIKELCKDIKKNGSLLLLDASQTFGHNIQLLKDVDFDASFGSGHKMYGPSIGFIIIRKELLKDLDYFFIGGSTVQDVRKSDFDLISDDSELYARIEPGLQNFAGIMGLNEAINWKSNFRKNERNSVQYEEELKLYLNKLLKELDVNLLNPNPSSVVSFYTDKIDSHRLGVFLSERNIMCRTGYHCCHYYLKNLKKFPPLFRISLGLNNTKEQIDFLMDNLKILTK